MITTDRNVNELRNSTDGRICNVNTKYGNGSDKSNYDNHENAQNAIKCLGIPRECLEATGRCSVSVGGNPRFHVTVSHIQFSPKRIHILCN